MNIAAPHPVVTPFTLRFVLEPGGGRFDACSPDSEAASDRILAVARSIGRVDRATCTVGMGVPSPRWADAATASMGALRIWAEGRSTFSDAYIALMAVEGTSDAQFDRVIGELEAALPPVFALHAVLSVTLEAETDGRLSSRPPCHPKVWCSCTGVSPTRPCATWQKAWPMHGWGQMRSIAVYMAARIVPDLPADWALRVLASLDTMDAIAEILKSCGDIRLEIQGHTDSQGREEMNQQLSHARAIGFQRTPARGAC